MKSGKLISAMALLVALAIPVSLAAQDDQGSKDATFITFDAPGAGTGAGQGTVPQAISPPGAVTGDYLDASNVFHAFLRAHHGAIKTFDAPGAGTGAFQGTQAWSITPAEAIAGFYTDASNVSHGFLRARHGTITTFDAPAAGTGAGQGTFAFNINPVGTIAGDYLDSSNVFHGFLRARHGTMTTFDVPGAGTGAFQGTFTATAQVLTPAGEITGWYVDASNVNHGYIRSPDGTYTTVDAPGAGTGPGQGTTCDSITPAGAIVAQYLDSNNVFHGLLRTPDGTITTFDVPGAGTGAFQGTLALNLNPSLAITGPYVDASDVNHGYLRARHGSITTFEAPGAGTGAGQGTIPYVNNPAGAITGWYIDASNVNHGFLRIPCDDNHDGGDCEEQAEGATATAQSSSALVTQNPTTTTEDNPSASARMGVLHGRLGRGYQRVVPQSGTASEARAAKLSSRTAGNGEANYITDDVEMFFNPPSAGRCGVSKGRLTGSCVAPLERFCSFQRDPSQCPPKEKAKRVGLRCGYYHVDELRPCG